MKSDFEKATPKKQAGLIREFAGFLRHNKKWWLTPIIVVLLALGILIILGSTGAAPFIYSFF